MSDDIVMRLRASSLAWRIALMPEAADEIERLCSALDTAIRERDEARAEVERLRDEDTKTRHALRGWVWVCPDGGDEPTHERVSAVVAEVERLTRERDEARYFLKIFVHAHASNNAVPPPLEEQARKALEAKS